MKKLKSFSFCFFTKFLQKKYFLILLVATTFIANGFFVSTVHAEATYVLDTILEEDTHWTVEESPYLITQTLFVDEGVTLTIDPGVIVKFDGWNTGLSIRGKIEAQGTESDPIYFTSIYDDIGGRTDDDFENCDYDSYDEEGNGIGEGVCVVENWYPPYVGDWDGLYFENSKGSVLNNAFIKYADDAIYAESSDVNFENLNISESTSGLIIYSDSNVEILSGTMDNLEEDAFTVYDNSSLRVDNFNISNVRDGFTGYVGDTYKYNHPEMESFTNEKIEITNTNLFCSNDGVTMYSDATLSINGGTVSCQNNGVSLYGGAIANINNTKISDSTNIGVLAFNNVEIPVVTNSEITANNYGFVVFNSAFSANHNSIHDNLTAGVITYDPSAPINFDFTNNWWGDKTGPTNPSNPEGIGDLVSDNILFDPFLKVDPLIEKTGISSVMLIPGFEASRMYKMKSYLGSDIEDKLWEPNAGADVRDMYMDDNGVSIDDDIYTRDIVDTATVFGVGIKRFYKSFMDKMDQMVANDEIAGWKAIAYDWRLSPTDIVNRGVKYENGNISYNEELMGGQVPYILDQLQKLADSSKSGKVTIVVHSNGGLVAKALVFKLEEMKKRGESNLVDNIDNIIFVGSPLLGTPEAIPALLHGFDQGKALNLLLSRKNARNFGQNVSGAYNLLPSEEYLNSIDNDLITLDSSLDQLNNWRTLYGDSVDNYNELGRFLSSVNGGRVQSGYNDLKNPLVLNENLFNKAETFHKNLDNLVFPETMKIYQVAGWGIPTTYGVEYKTKNECSSFLDIFCISKKLTLSSDLGLVSGGDGTVIADTALAGNGTDYYLNLGEYNQDNKTSLKKNHADMFDISSLFDLVNNILKEDPTLPQYVTTNQPQPVDFTVIKMHSPVAIDMYNGEGLHTGVLESDDPDSEIIEENIPNSSYLEVGDEKYIIVPSDSNYRLELTGQSDGIFTLEQELIVNDSIASSVQFNDYSTTSNLRGEANIDAGSLLASVSLDRNNDNIFDLTIYGDTTEEIAKDKIINHSSSGSIPFPVSVISDRTKNEIPNIVLNVINNTKLLEKLSQGAKNNLPETIKSDGNIKISVNEMNVRSQSTSASAGDSDIINYRTILFIIVIMIILLARVRLIYKVKK